MSYAAPLYYAAKALSYDHYQPAPQQQARQRRRRIRLVLFPAQRPHRPQASVATANSVDC